MLNGDVLTDLDLTAQIERARAHGRDGDAGADPGRGPVAVRPRAHRRRRRGDRVRREALARPDRHAQHLRRRVRARARGARPARARAARLDRARRVPAARRRRALRLRRPRATGSTSGRPPATCRAPTTSSRAPSARRWPSAWATATCASSRASRTRGRIIPSALVETGCRIGDGARIGGARRARERRHVGDNTTIERAVVMQGAEIGANCTLRGCIVAGGVARRRRLRDRRPERPRRGRDARRRQRGLQRRAAVPRRRAARPRAALLVTATGAAPRSRRGRRGRRHAARPRRSSTCRCTCATRCGAWTRRASRRSTPRAG